MVKLEIEIYCDNCSEELEAVIRNQNEIYISPCVTCETKWEDQIDELNNEISDLQDQIATLEEEYGQD